MDLTSVRILVAESIEEGRKEEGYTCKEDLGLVEEELVVRKFQLGVEIQLL